METSNLTPTEKQRRAAIDKLFEDEYFKRKIHDFIVNNLEVIVNVDSRGMFNYMTVNFEGDLINVDYECSDERKIF